MRRVLLIAFHYPPFGTSSGVQRTLSFSVHLRRYGWQPYVLTVRPEVYERSSPDQLHDIPNDVEVRRTTALDAARHVAIRGRYWSRLALPDRWSSWWLSAVPAGLRLIQKAKIDVIWSTYPIATAHRIGATLARLSRRPWVADFRDPMVEWVPAAGRAFPADPALRKARLDVESRAVRDAGRLVFCTEGARDIVLSRYPSLDRARTAVISNGYEEQAFEAAVAMRRPADTGRKRVLLHSGTVYLGPDRDPTAVMQAVRMLADLGLLSSDNFELRLRDPSNEAALRKMAEGLGLEELISILPPLPYRDALAEMLSADGLLLLQGENSNPAVPAKLYEYLRARRPILACAHPDGETARTLRKVGISTIAPLTDVQSIGSLLRRWIDSDESLLKELPSEESIAGFSREHLTAALSAVLADLPAKQLSV